MGSVNRLSSEDQLEAQLLADPVSQDEEEDIGPGRIIYRATFQELEDNYVNYDTVRWIMMSLLLILAWGVGIFMLLYLPIRRYVVRKDIRTRKLYVTTDAIVHKMSRPILPCCGVRRREKYLLLPLVTDVIIEQGCMQSAFGVSSIRFETAGFGRPTHVDDIHIEGVVNPRLLRKVVLMAVSNLRKDRHLNGGSMIRSTSKEDIPVEEFPPQHPSTSYASSWPWQPQVAGLTSWQVGYTPASTGQSNENQLVPGEKILQKLEQVEDSLKRIEILIEGQQIAK
ncbi:hypothetical protein O6H91_01G025600 [Diphasiastrum complanatum]|uniref:Uncharacterized protein n=2 Tax=Diphasiastrum complanatum TaxID=34168 RepID=A0ACC2EP99_DIPCM|nr:hypothetical protein O6H91_01G025600 [Diphasiastrum complanatum]